VTIAKGQPWGVAAPLPPDCPIVSTDAALAALVDFGGPVGVIGGDLCRTLGGRGSVDRLRSDDATTFPVDALRVALDDGVTRWCVAHVVARSSGWRRVFIAANAQWLGEWNVAPRGHPDDGRVETLSWRLGWRAVRQVMARLPQGTHLPHPAIAVSSAPAASHSFRRPAGVWIDGVRVGRTRSLTVTVAADAMRVVV